METRTNRAAQPLGESRGSLAGIVGTSVATRRLRDRIRALAPLRVAVLVTGEEGSGRDHAVRILHSLGAGSEGALVRLAGRSAGARRLPTPGRAHYLDEVGRFTLSEQLHWFECMCRAEGDPGGLRVFASTSQDLVALARKGEFHGGFAERLSRFEIHTAPLRERPEDIVSLVTHFADRMGREMGRSRVRVAAPAMALLASASWPGNVRELAETLEKLVAFSPGGEVTLERVREVFGELPDSVATLRQQRRDAQREELVLALEACGGNLAEVARRLGISRGAVIYRAQKFGLLPRRMPTGRVALRRD